jgi:hypothetical protein
VKCGECSSSKRISVLLLLVGAHEGLGKYIIPIDTIEVLRERVENAATTVRNSRGRLLERVERFVGAFIIV